MIPLLRCSNMKEAVFFYTHILDFRLKDSTASVNDVVVNLINGEAELQLTSLEGNQTNAIAVNVRVSNVDALFAKYMKRGLNTSPKKDSPVHQGPLNQTWGTREFYVTDPDGNTLRFNKIIE
jgi:uncharacterized glyoxalase superfamily protein PhnB